MQTFLRFLAAAAILTASTANVYAGPRTQAPPADKTPPSYDMKAQAVLDLQDMQKKFTSLAEAIPQDKYNWRPSDGVRSVGEVFLHTSAAGFNFPTMRGIPAAPGFVGKGFEKSTTDKTQIIEWLNKSFAYSIASVQSMTNAQFAAALPKLGPDANEGDVVYLMVVHAHEMLGQAIAYSRAVGVVPPWTAAAQKKSQQNP